MNYVALLRGINVGGITIKMVDLTNHFDWLGFQNVTTILQTGNVVFSSDGSPGVLKDVIEASLTKAFNYSAKVQIVSVKKLQHIITEYPFSEEDETLQNYILFFENGLERDLAIDAHDINQNIERILTGDGVLYWQVPKGMTLKSDFAQFLTKPKYKAFHTNRNLKTLRKLV